MSEEGPFGGPLSAGAHPNPYRAFLIAFYSTSARTIMWMQFASDYPVSQMGGDIRQILVAEGRGKSYHDAHQHLVSVLKSEYYKWVRDYEMKGGWD